MTKTVSITIPLECLPGVEPSTEATAFSTEHYTDSQNIRFTNGKPEKIGGWNEQLFDNGTISGVVRSIYSTVFANRVQTIYGTNSKIYTVSGSVLTNVTPVSSTSTAAPGSIATMYGVLNNPVTTINGSSTIMITDPESSRLVAGDAVTLSGASAVGGISGANINGTRVIRMVGAGYYEIIAGSAATSTTTGGGSINRSTGLLQVTKTAQGQQTGERTKIEGSTDVGGILAADINRQFIVRNAAANTFDIMTDGVATSSVTGGGGASVVFYPEISDGEINEVAGQGYGMGFYGEGLYGTSLLSNQGRVLPRIWFFDKYSDSIIANAGNGTPVYSWDGSQTNAPTPVPNAPTDVNYAFISDNILVTFGVGGVSNKIFSSDQGDIDNWTASSTNFVYEKNVDGAGRFLSHAQVNGTNLIWTEQRAYTMRFVGLPNVWSIKLLEPIGIIAPMARVAVNGRIVWMGLDNFYMWSGGNVEIVRSNSSTHSTLLKYVFENLNYSQKSKCFAWYNKKFNEIWFHYPTEDSNEPNRVAVVSVNDFTWFPLEMERTAAEYPETNLSVPRLADTSSRILRHESGYNNINAPLPWMVQTNKKKRGPKVLSLTAVIPDSIQDGNITLNQSGWENPQSAQKSFNKDYIVETTTSTAQAEDASKVYQHTISGDQLDQFWRMGDWELEVQPTGFN